MIWAALRWVPLMFLIAPAMEAPLVAHLNQPAKPIKTWVGNASWYGPGFDGRKTANGERFDMYALTAAHLKLPMNTHVRVINLRNGRSVVVRINDRGPYGGRCIIDVSYAAAKLLDMLNAGIVPVRLEVLGP